MSKQMFADNVPYFKLSDEKRAEIEAEAKALRAEIATPNLHPGAKTRAKLRLAHVERLLELDKRGAGVPDRSSKDQYVEHCKAGQQFTTPSGATYEHQCSCGRHQDVLNARETEQRQREDAPRSKRR